jgi:hypothetical protein
MAFYNQIYSIVNSAAAQSMGGAAVTATDTAGFVSLGSQVLSSSTNVEAFYGALMNRIVKTINVNRKFNGPDRGIRRDNFDFGAVLQKIAFTPQQAVTNPSIANAQSDPFDPTIGSGTVSQKLFSKKGTWSHEELVPTEVQMAQAFVSEENFAAFLAAIYTTIENLIEKERVELDNLAVSTMIANTIANGQAGQVKHVLTDFNQDFGQSYTADDALVSPTFYRYMNGQILRYVKRIQDLTTLYNAGQMQRHTPVEDLTIDILSDYDVNSQIYMESDTYHKELVQLPGYNSINYWQGMGTADTIAERSKISIDNAEVKASTVTQDYVLATIYDKEAVGTMFDRLRVNTIFNPRSDMDSVFWKADKGYFVDGNENNIVFVLD